MKAGSNSRRCIADSNGDAPRAREVLKHLALQAVFQNGCLCAGCRADTAHSFRVAGGD
jgi:hypothetical protein